MGEEARCRCFNRREMQGDGSTNQSVAGIRVMMLIGFDPRSLLF
jgi:hypothetical protein